MEKFTEKLRRIQTHQSTIDELLTLGELVIDKDYTNSWALEPLYSTDECCAGIVRIESKLLGACRPHIHDGAKEYLICVTGSFILNINGNSIRTLVPGDCAVVNPGEIHYSKPLEDNTSIFYVCVPADKGMKLLDEQLKRDYNDGRTNHKK